MAYKPTVAQTSLNATTIDILNVIRENASPSYQAKVPEITDKKDIRKVGEVIYGEPALANEFINALVNRIALVRATGLTFNNPYSNLKKGILEFGDVIEDIFIGIAKVQKFDVDKAPAREMKRTTPNAKSVFHTVNWTVLYPVSIEEQQLERAFLSADGVTDLIAKIVEQVYVGAEYDEYLLFKYMLIKNVASGHMYPVSIGDTSTDMKTSAIEFRGKSNLITFPKRIFNEQNVLTSTPREKQIIFMDSEFNAKFDVDVLAGAFNMDKAEFVGRLHLIDDFTSFDNDRWEEIREQSDGLEEVTAEELALMQGVKAILIDEDWFQVYDKVNKFTEDYIASGLYWNYFYHVWKIVSHSPFANAIVFCDGAIPALPDEITITVMSKDVSDVATTVVTLLDRNVSLANQNYRFVQTEDLVENAIAVQPFGAYLVPSDKTDVAIKPTIKIGDVEYTTDTGVTAQAMTVGQTITLTKVE